MEQRYCRREAWSVTVRPACGEITCTAQTGPTHREQPKRGEAQDPERAAKEAVRRARTKVRRLCCQHGLTRLWTLTLAPAYATHDYTVLGELVRRFQERLRERFPGEPYLIVAELHPEGHGWHLHMLLGRYHPESDITGLWPFGFVSARKIRTKGDGGRREASRRAAHYAAKYIAKATEEVPAGTHRYWRPQGMSVEELHAEVHSSEIHRLLCLYKGSEPVQFLWKSADDPEWRGPPTIMYWW